MRHAIQKPLAIMLALCLFAIGRVPDAAAINIVIDYQYDTNNFFDTDLKRDALQAAADRFSSMIATTLSESTLTDNSLDPRISFTHPGSGSSWQVSAANSQVTDAIVGASGPVAQEYRGTWNINKNEWILYAGGRSIGSAGIGGTGTGTNFTTVFNDGSSHLNRGFRASGSASNLPVWGGAITFDNDGGVNWHYDPNTAAPLGTTDFYTIAIHEIGHALGLATGWNEWMHTGSSYNGANAIAAYNADNGATETSLNLVSGTNEHWEDGTYDSIIYPYSDPIYVGTEGEGNLQDLLMEPTANFSVTRRRIELTNTDVAALEDIGWDVRIPADANNDGVVNGLDANIVSGNFLATSVDYDDGDFNGDDVVNGLDANILSSNWLLGSPAQAVPEPSAFLLATVAALALGTTRRRRRSDEPRLGC